MMRRLFVLLTVGALVCAVSATTAFALTNNTVDYKVKLKKKGKPSKHHPALLQYEGILDVGTTDGMQPNVAPITKIYFPKQIVQHAKNFPSCNPASNQTNPNGLDGARTPPASCKKAVIGKGKATAYPGFPPGGPLGTTLGLKEALTVTAYNGLKGKQILLALNGSSPQVIQNRVIIGTIGRGKGPYGYSVSFAVPQDLQFQSGFQVALTHFDVTIQNHKKVKVKGKKVSYLGLTKCPKNHKLPTETTVFFAQDGVQGQPPPAGGPKVTSKGKMKC
jgi:hypothetical protein